MKIKSLLIFVFTLMSLTAFAQSGGIKGKVVSREGRVAVDGVKVSVTPGEMTATTDGRGGFVIENVEITPSEENDYFLRCTGNSNQRGWGTSGARRPGR